MSELPEGFHRRITGAFGEAGTKWLEALPALLQELATYWGITIQEPFADMAYRFVAPAVRDDGSEVVVKAGVPNRELRAEITALGLFDGHGSVRLLEALPERGAFLLERLKPGRALFHLHDDEAAISAACGIMAKLWEAGPAAGFPTVPDWARGLERLRKRFDGGTGPFPSRLVETAEGLFKDLISSMAEVTLLHGDLHHWNILSAEREPWLAIDPQGVIGEPAYEVGAWLRNPFPFLLEEPRLDRLTKRRVDQFAAELGLERDRLLGWGVAQAVLSTWWAYEDGEEDPNPWLAVAEAIASVR